MWVCSTIANFLFTLNSKFIVFIMFYLVKGCSYLFKESMDFMILYYKEKFNSFSEDFWSNLTNLRHP